MKRKFSVTVVLIVSLTGCTTPVSELKRQQQRSIEVGLGEQEPIDSTIVAQGEEEPAWAFSTELSPMLGFGALVRNQDLLISDTDEHGRDIMESGGYGSAAASINTFHIDGQGEAQGESMVSRVEFGTKNRVKYACQGTGRVLVEIAVDDKTVKETTVECTIPSNEISIEVDASKGHNLSVNQQPTAQTRGLYGIAIYD